MGVKDWGTYQLQVILENPPVAEPTTALPKRYYQLRPKAESIVPDILLVGVGVVRHIYDRGLTGLVYRVPEPDNDDVFEQVVASTPRVDLRGFYNKYWIHAYETALPKIDHTIAVLTNHPSASCSIRDAAGNLIGTGSGHETKIPVSGLSSNTTGTITFYPILSLTDESRKTVATTSPAVRSFPIRAAAFLAI